MPLSGPVRCTALGPVSFPAFRLGKLPTSYETRNGRKSCGERNSQCFTGEIAVQNSRNVRWGKNRGSKRCARAALGEGLRPEGLSYRTAYGDITIPSEKLLSIARCKGKRQRPAPLRPPSERTTGHP